jgi:hypothetical protein
MYPRAIEEETGKGEKSLTRDKRKGKARHRLNVRPCRSFSTTHAKLGQL